MARYEPHTYARQSYFNNIMVKGLRKASEAIYLCFYHVLDLAFNAEVSMLQNLAFTHSFLSRNPFTAILILSLSADADEFSNTEASAPFFKTSSSSTCLWRLLTNDNAFSLVQCVPAPVMPDRADLCLVSAWCSSSSSCDKISAFVKLSTAIAKKTFSRVSFRQSRKTKFAAFITRDHVSRYWNVSSLTTR